MRTIARHLRMEPYHRPSVKQELEGMVKEVLADRELSDIINTMRDKVYHGQESQESRQEYKIVLSRAILKYGYRAIDEMYR